MNMAEGDVEVNENSTNKSKGIVREILRPFGSEAYNESREAGKGHIHSIIKGLLSALMPATYSMVEKNKAGRKEDSSANNGTFAKWLGYTSAFTSDFLNNVIGLTPNGPIFRYAYGQIATRVHAK